MIIDSTCSSIERRLERCLEQYYVFNRISSRKKVSRMYKLFGAVAVKEFLRINGRDSEIGRPYVVFWENDTVKSVFTF